MLIRQLFYGMLSAYTYNPLNLAINSPSGTGKIWVIQNVAELFPKEDVLGLSGMTTKAIFHRPGTTVIKDDNGNYIPLKDEIAEIEVEDSGDRKNWKR
jgi:hypothetical protein